MTTFETVERIFEDVYAELREANGENAPNSYTWFARTPAELAEEVGDILPESIGDRIEGNPDCPDFDDLIGDVNAETIAWVFECNGDNLDRITATATEEEIRELFERNMNLAEVD